MPKYKVEFSDKTTTLPEHELDFPNVEAACKGARKIASELRADGMFMGSSGSCVGVLGNFRGLEACM